ncbi:hypothetical protein FHL15_003107 [Xylaria flabelliformis]|uniref:Uncharacterized protein n=1 Tax=Xylaria flabelliformis TaxID=2512241 RepID=A0A553I6Y3_9PEZI|nr:hypothetical protein FHL15_003107 [Xylaria flabelliformis]
MSLNGANKSNHLMRIMPDISRLIPDESGNMVMASHSSNGYGSSTSSAPHGGGAAAFNYEDSDLNSITRSQMVQDLIAYRYDLEFCQTQLATQEDLSPQELRTLQIRTLDCAHNIRHCKHRIQVLDAQARLGIAPYSTSTFRGSGSGTGAYRSGGTASVTGKNKRQRIDKSESDDVDVTMNTAIGGEAAADPDADGADDSIVAAGTDGYITTRVSPGVPTHTLQRLGYWDCRLCRSRKYLEAGSNRVPSAPCKWPLKDISKMINHFLDLHTEHTPQERCNELGDALERNRGPFEYWLTRTKGQEIEDTSLIDDYVRMLQSGSLPDAMRGLLRAATMFPNTVSNSYKK